MKLAGLRMEGEEAEGRTSKFELTLGMVEGEEGLSGALEYNSDLYDAGTVARLLVHLRVLLESAVTNPEQRVEELPLMEEAEQRRVVEEWRVPVHAHANS